MTSHHRSFAMAGALLVLASLAPGCAQTAPSHPEVATEVSAFFQAGRVSEESLLLCFGAPTGRFEDDRIMTWRIGLTYTGHAGPAVRNVMDSPGIDRDADVWRGTLYDLVVVLDEQRAVKQFKLIPVQRE